MARITKAELEQQVATLTAELEHVRADRQAESESRAEAWTENGQLQTRLARAEDDLAWLRRLVERLTPAPDHDTGDQP